MRYLFSEGEGCLWKVVAFLLAIILIAHGPIGWGILAFFGISLLILRLIIRLRSSPPPKSARIDLSSETPSLAYDKGAVYATNEEVEAVDNTIRDVLQEMNQNENRKPLSASTPLSPPNFPDDLENILRDISQGRIKDLVTQGRFRSGEKVYLCLTHRLAYHEDTWQGIGYKCEVCGHGKKTKLYTLPTSDDLPEKETNILDSEIEVYLSEESIDF